MTVDDLLISRLAQLAKLDLDPATRQRLQQDLEKILEMVEKLNELDLEGVEPMRYVSETELVLRPDEVKHQLERAVALRNAPDQDPTGEFFRVPKVINT